MLSLRLWHQLTLTLTEFVKNEYFAQNGGLVEVCQYCINYVCTVCETSVKICKKK